MRIPTLSEHWSILSGRTKVLWEILLGRLRLRTDFVGYRTLLRYISRKDLWRLAGNVLEIGAFMGGGTAKLARTAARYGKTVVVIDYFSPESDLTENVRGESMAWIYKSILGRRDLWSTFNTITSTHKNIVVYRGDSREVELPKSSRFMFSFIDGGHSPEIVWSDFTLCWPLTVPGGVVAFHDYGGDLPTVTGAINGIVASVQSEVAEISIDKRKSVIFIKKVMGSEVSGDTSHFAC